MPTSTVTFYEESLPIPVAETFNLTDLDSPDLVGTQFAVVVTVTNAVDGITYEGLLFNTMGTNVTVQVTEQDQFTISYTLGGSDTYSVYENVSTCLLVLLSHLIM